MSWQLFEQSAARYEAWYSTPRGKRADTAERGLLLRLLERFPDARHAVEIGCGTGHFASFLAQRGLGMVGLDRSLAMLSAGRQQSRSLSAVLGDAGRLPFRDKSTDLAIFVTTLEFLEDPVCALRDAVRVARQGVIAIALNRYSLGAISRRWGPQSRGALLGYARDYSFGELRGCLNEAASSRAAGVRMASTLFPDGCYRSISRIPLGDVIGAAVKLSSGAPGRY